MKLIWWSDQDLKVDAIRCILISRNLIPILDDPLLCYNSASYIWKSQGNQ